MTFRPNPEDEMPDLLSAHFTRQAGDADATGDTAPEFIPGLWSAIQSQLSQDLATDTLSENAPSPEFISAYHDQEILDKVEIDTFEAQLAQSPDSCHLLANIREVSDAIRQFGDRLMDACTVDVTAAVLGSYQDDTPVPLAIELLSADVDNALTAYEQQQLATLLKQDATLATQRNAFTELSKHIRLFSERLTEQPGPAIDCWTAIQNTLGATKVIPMNVGRSKRTFPLRAFGGVSIAAAVGLLVFMNWPSLQSATLSQHSPDTQQLSQLPALPVAIGKESMTKQAGASENTGSSAPADTQADTQKETEPNAQDSARPSLPPNSPAGLLPGSSTPTNVKTHRAGHTVTSPSIVATRNLSPTEAHQTIQRLELASALDNPLSFNGGLSGFNYSGDLMATPAAYGRDSIAPRIYVRPIAEDATSNVASSQSKMDKTVSDTASAVPSRQYPSAEEYLFNTLKEDPNGNEVNVIYGI